MNNTTKHCCDTQNPQRPCCWAARAANLRAAGIYAKPGESREQQAERRAEVAAPALAAQRADDARIKSEGGFITRGLD